MIDHARLDELEADFGPSELEQIIASFLEEARDAIGALAFVGEDPVPRRERLHFIKGCARMIGAAELGDLCEKLEIEPAFGTRELRLLEAEFGVVAEALKGSRTR